MRVRGSKRKRFVMEQRKAAKEKRAAESKVGKEKRAAKGKAGGIARAKQRSPEGKKAAESLKETRKIVREKEQAHYQKTLARGSARMGGRRKQIQAELHAKVEE
jgi:hypothetical protein